MRVQQISRLTISLPKPPTAISHSLAYGNMSRALTGSTKPEISEMNYRGITAALATHDHTHAWPKDAIYVLSIYDTPIDSACNCVWVSVFPKPSKMDPQLEEIYKSTLNREYSCDVSGFLQYTVFWWSHILTPK